MGEVLSQDEIDNLLKALSSGELDVDEMKNGEEKQVKNYDFARPSKFSKEHLRTLEIIFEHFGRLLATNLPAYLRKTVSVDVFRGCNIFRILECAVKSSAVRGGEYEAACWQYGYGDGFKSGICYS